MTERLSHTYTSLHQGVGFQYVNLGDIQPVTGVSLPCKVLLNHLRLTRMYNRVGGMASRSMLPNLAWQGSWWPLDSKSQSTLPHLEASVKAARAQTHCTYHCLHSQDGQHPACDPREPVPDKVTFTMTATENQLLPCWPAKMTAHFISTSNAVRAPLEPQVHEHLSNAGVNLSAPAFWGREWRLMCIHPIHLRWILEAMQRCCPTGDRTLLCGSQCNFREGVLSRENRTQMRMCSRCTIHVGPQRLLYKTMWKISPIIFTLCARFCCCCSVTESCPILCDPMDCTTQTGRLQSMGSRRVGHDSDFTFIFPFHALEKEMATHSSVLVWRIPGTEAPGGLPFVGSHRVRHDWSDLAVAAATVGFPVLHDLPEFAQTHVHWVSNAIQPSHALPSPSLPVLNLSQHQGLFQWVSCSHQVAKILELQLQY